MVRPGKAGAGGLLDGVEARAVRRRAATRPAPATSPPPPASTATTSWSGRWAAPRCCRGSSAPPSPRASSPRAPRCWSGPAPATTWGLPWGSGSALGTPSCRSTPAARSSLPHDRPTADPRGFVAGYADATGGFLPLVCTLNAGPRSPRGGGDAGRRRSAWRSGPRARRRSASRRRRGDRSARHPRGAWVTRCASTRTIPRAASGCGRHTPTCATRCIRGRRSHPRGSLRAPVPR